MCVSRIKCMRKYDIVFFGATGFTGKLVAQHLAQRAPKQCKVIKERMEGRSTKKNIILLSHFLCPRVESRSINRKCHSIQLLFLLLLLNFLFCVNPNKMQNLCHRPITLK